MGHSFSLEWVHDGSHLVVLSVSCSTPNQLGSHMCSCIQCLDPLLCELLVFCSFFMLLHNDKGIHLHTVQHMEEQQHPSALAQWRPAVGSQLIFFVCTSHPVIVIICHSWNLNLCCSMVAPHCLHVLSVCCSRLWLSLAFFVFSHPLWTVVTIVTASFVNPPACKLMLFLHPKPCIKLFICHILEFFWRPTSAGMSCANTTNTNISH